MNDLRELFENSQTVLGLCGVVIVALISLCTWLLKRAFSSVEKMVGDMSEKMDLKMAEVDKKLEAHKTALHAIDKEIAVNNEKNSGVISNVKDILKTTISNFDKFGDRLDNLEHHVFRSAKTKQTKNRREANV